MLIENAVLKKMVGLGKSDCSESGVYIQGINGKIEMYAFNGYCLYRKVLQGNNKREFLFHSKQLAIAKGYMDSDSFMNMEYMENTSTSIAAKINKFRKLLLSEENPAVASVLMKGRDFFGALKTVDMINRGESLHNVVISFHNGFLNVAAWTDTERSMTLGEEFGVYEEVTPAPEIEGSIVINYSYIKGVSTTGNVTLELIHSDDIPLIRYRTSGMDFVIMPKIVDTSQFLTVLGYECKELVSTGIIQEAKEEKPTPKKTKEKKVVTIRREEKLVAPKGDNVKTLHIYGDREGRWLSVPKKILTTHNLWDKISTSAFESKILIFCEEGTEADAVINALKATGIEVNIESNPLEKGRSTIRKLPHYQKVG